MTTPAPPIEKASDHPRYNGSGATAPEPPVKRIDTSAARERVETARNAKRASDKPPTRRKATADTPVTPPVAYSAGMFKAPISTLYGQVGSVVSYVAYPLGVAITQQAGPCAEAWDHVAKQNPRVRQWLLNMTKTGAWGELFAAHLPIFMTTLMLFGPESFRERMGGVVADSVDQMGASDQGHNVQDPN